MAKRARAITFDLDCPNKKITITWKILITGIRCTDTLADELIEMFKLWYQKIVPMVTPDGLPWSIGTCKVYFKLDIQKGFEREATEAELNGDRDIIDIRRPKVGGGGAEGDLGDGTAPLVIIEPDSTTGDLSEWKSVHEMGHGLGIDDPKNGDWLTNQAPNNVIRPRHIEEILNKAPNDKKRAINECCRTHLTVAMGDTFVFPDGEFLASNPRDPLYEIFPPGSENPFSAAFTKKMVQWQQLVQRVGLTAAYTRWVKLYPSVAKVEKKYGSRRGKSPRER